MAAAVTLSLAALEAFDPEASRQGREWRFCCPCPPCADKPVNRAHRSLSVQADSGLWHCYRCQSGGKLTEHWVPTAQVRAVRLRRAYALAPETTDQSPDDKAAAVAEQIRRGVPLPGTPGEDYLKRRGIPVHVAAGAGALYSPGFYGRRPAVLFPLRDQHGRITAVAGRYIDGRDDPKALTIGHAKPGVFATPEALTARPLVIVEGPICALSLAWCGVPTVALGGVTWPTWLPKVAAFRRVIVALDNDAAGDAAAAKLTADLQAFGARPERWRPLLKDWNHVLTNLGRKVLAGALKTGAALNDGPVSEEPDDPQGEALRLQRLWRELGEPPCYGPWGESITNLEQWMSCNGHERWEAIRWSLSIWEKQRRGSSDGAALAS